QNRSPRVRAAISDSSTLARMVIEASKTKWSWYGRHNQHNRRYRNDDLMFRHGSGEPQKQ
ncbi:MAG TPA: hypothetical protein VGI45_16680, partial [Terracidiphilus sp.]